MKVATNSMKAWFLAARPKTLGAISCPIIIGNSLAYRHHQFSWSYFFLMLASGLVLQVLANVVNDYGDFVKGSDSDDRLGPPRAMQMGFITKEAMTKGIGFCLFLALLLGLPLAFVGGPIIFLLGIVAVFLCFAYTMGPMPLAYLGFSEIIIFLVFGPMIVLGSYFVQTNAISTEAFLASMSPGFMAAALLLTNNLRDMNEDKRNNKRTIAVRFGDDIARKLIIGLIFCAFFGPLILVQFFSMPTPVLLSSLALALPIRHLPMIASDPISRRFNLMLSAIGQSLYLFGLFFAIGLAYGEA